MPAKSRKQQRYLYATKGEAWVKAHHFDNHFGRSSEQAGHPTANVHRARKRKKGKR
jgi:hypothetical protein